MFIRDSKAPPAGARVPAAIYVFSVLIGFGPPAGYHRLARGARSRRIMQRMDHSTIFILIAGSYTPICLLALPRAWGIPPVSYTHLRAHETVLDLVCRLLLEKKNIHIVHI